MKAFFRLMEGVCAVGNLLVQALFRKNKVVSAARMASLMMSDELLMMNTSCTFFPQKGTQKLLAANLLSKLVRLLSRCYPKLWRPVFSATSSFSLGPLHIQKNIDKTTCNSRLTGKRGLKAYDAGYLKPYEVRKFFNKLNGFTYRCLHEAGMTMKKGVALAAFKLPCLYISTACFSCRNRAARPIQKITEKTTCNSRVTGKRGLRSFRDIFCWFFTVKNCIKKRWKFAYRFLRKVEMMPRHKVETARGKSLASYVLYLATIKILFCVCLAHARQSSSPEAAHGVALSTDSVKPLQIGDTVPEALWSLPLQMVKAGQEGSTTVTLNDYRGKLIILDFWSTWCSACIAAMPKLLHLQQTFYQSIQVLPVSFQATQKVREGYDHNKILKSIPMFSIVEDQFLQQAFPHQILPHVVWITPDGKFAAATSSNLLTSIYIQEALDGKLYRWPVKEELRQLYDLPLLVPNENLSTSKANCYYSVLTPYQKGINNYHVKQLADTVSGTVRWQFINHSIRSLYLKALGRFNDFPRNRIICEGISPDTVLFDAHQAGLNRDAWYQKHAVSYETQLPLQTSFNAVKAKLLSDLNNYLALNVRLEQRVMPCFRLVLTDAKRLREAAEDAEYSNTLLDKTAPIKKLIAAPPSRLVASLNQMANMPPILDGTDFKGKLDLTLHLDDVSDINKLNEQLMRYGLLLQAGEERIEVLVISKN